MTEAFVIREKQLALAEVTYIPYVLIWSTMLTTFGMAIVWALTYQSAS